MATPAASAATTTTVVQLDTRNPASGWAGARRTWPGGPDHSTQRKRYLAANPLPGARPHWCVTPVVNAWACGVLGWTYRMELALAPAGRHPSWCKLRHVLDRWDDLKGVTVVMDTDAWIREPRRLRLLLDETLRDGCVYVAAGEPDGKECARAGAEAMNGGFFAFLKDDRVRDFLQRAWDAGAEGRRATEWPWEQACLSAAHAADVAGCSQWLRVLPVEACNTPAGRCVAHCWYKELVAPLALDDLLVAMAREHMPAAFVKPSVEIVVARHGEDVAWLDEWVQYVQKITVYDKSDVPMAPRPGIGVVPLPNVGREAHTYAHHLAEAYDSLCDVVVFTQGGFADHCTPQQFEALVLDGKPLDAAPLEMAWWSSPMRHFGWTPQRNHAKAVMTPAGCSLAKFLLTHGVVDDLPPERDVTYWQGAIFRATAAAVRRHARAKYAALRDVLASGGSNPETAHMMERAWRLLLA